MEPIDERAQEELEQEDEELCRRTAIRASYAYTDGYFTAEEFQHLLYKLGQHKERT